MKDGQPVISVDAKKKLAESYRAGLSPHLDHAVRVADPFHVVRVANRCLDTVRRRVQNDLLGHRGRKNDPLYRIRKLLLSGPENRRRRFISKHAPECDTDPLKATRSRRHRNDSGIALRALTGPPGRARRSMAWRCSL